MRVCLNGLLSTQEGFLSPAPVRLLPQSHRQRIETFEGPKISVCVQGLQIKWILPLKWDARPYFLPVLELKHVWERERYDMLISDSRTIGIGSEEKRVQSWAVATLRVRPSSQLRTLQYHPPPRRDAVQTRGEKRSLSGLFDKKSEMYGF